MVRGPPGQPVEDGASSPGAQSKSCKRLCRSSISPLAAPMPLRSSPVRFERKAPVLPSPGMAQRARRWDRARWQSRLPLSLEQLASCRLCRGRLSISRSRHGNAGAVAVLAASIDLPMSNVRLRREQPERVAAVRATARKPDHLKPAAIPGFVMLVANAGVPLAVELKCFVDFHFSTRERLSDRRMHRSIALCAKATCSGSAALMCFDPGQAAAGRRQGRRHRPDAALVRLEAPVGWGWDQRATAA